jgi:predicted transcriptional regulator
VARQPILETAIMNVLWDDGDWVAPGEVRKRLTREIAPTTVSTVLTRLHEKGWVERRKHGKGFRYRTVDTREQHMEAALEASRDRPLALLEFVDRLPPADRSRLRRILGL